MKFDVWCFGYFTTFDKSEPITECTGLHNEFGVWLSNVKHRMGYMGIDSITVDTGIILFAGL